MRVSLSLAIPAFLLAVGLAAVGIGAVVVSWRVPAEVMDDAESDTAVLASLHSGEIAYHLRQDNLADAHVIMDRLKSDRSLVEALLIDNEGNIVLATRRALLDRSISETDYAPLRDAVQSTARRSRFQTWSDASEYSVHSLFPVQLHTGGREPAAGRTGVYLLHRDVSPLVAERLGLAREILAWLAAILGLVSLALWLFLRTLLLRRVGGLIQSLDDVGRPGFSTPQRAGDIDELSRIEGALNAASDRIVNANRQLIESEARFRGIFNSAFQFIALLRRDGTLTEVNRTALDFGGLKAEQVVGKPFWETPWWRDGDPDIGTLKQAIERAAGGQFARCETGFLGTGDERVIIDLSITPITDDAGTIALLVAEGRDVTQRRRAERENERLRQLYQTLSKANESIIRLPDKQSAFERICEVIVEYGGFPLAWIGEPAPGGAELRYVAASGATDYLDHLRISLDPDNPADQSLASRVLHSNRPQIINNMQSCDSGIVQKDLAQQYNFAAVAIFPLRCAGDIVALMTVYAAELDYFSDTETRLLNELADDVSFALENERRAEALKQSEERHRHLFLSNPHPMWIYDLDTLGFLEVNDMAVEHYGYTREEFLSMGIADIRPAEDVPALRDNVSSVAQGLDEAGVWRHVRKDGTIIDVEITSHTLDWKNHPAELVLAHDVTDRRRAEKELRIAAAAFEVQEGIIVADANNVIERVNQAFTRITGYRADEAIGKQPNILQSGRHDRAFYEEMWRRITKDGYWEGEVWNRRKSGEIFPEWLTISAVTDAGGRISHYVGSFVDITEDKEAEKRIHQLAFYDPLTDLANRRLLMDRLGRALASSSRSGATGAVLMLDFDHFKILNDTRGHAAGDSLLVEAANRLRAGVRESDSVARIGGDEFTIVLEGLDDDEDTAAGEAVRRAHQLQSALGRPYDLAEVSDYRITVSVGIALFKGRGLLVDDLLKQADVALYEAKSDGRNALRFFNPEQQNAIELRASIEADLRRAIHNDEFELHYQPQIDRDGGIAGAEALLRWLPPDRDPIPPDVFIPVAEESGQIVAIGNWVLDAACRELKRWQSQASTRHLSLSVNVSARHFNLPEFADDVRTHLQHNEAEPSRLFLEITESVGIQPIDRVTTQFTRLKKLGIQFSIDDFGTGYSSLSYIQRLPVDQIKIDRTFVDGLPEDANSASVVRAILAMGHAFGLHVVAEGVETEKQRAFLQREGCDGYQGFYFGRPVPLAEFEAMLQRQ